MINTGRAAALKTLADLISRGAGVITFPILAARVGADGFGRYSLVTSVVALAVPFVSLGVANGLVRYLSNPPWTPEVARSAIRLVAIVGGMGVVAGAILFSLSGELNRVLLDDWILGTQLFRSAGLLVAIAVVELMTLELLRSRERLIAYSLFQILHTLGLVVSIIFFVKGPEGIISLIIALASIKGGLCIIFLLSLLVQTIPSGPVIYKAPPMTRLVRFGFPLAVSGIGLWILNVGDRLVIGANMSDSDLGRYSAVFAISSLLTLAGAGFLLPALPRMVRTRLRGDPIEADIRIFHRYLSFALIPAAFFLLGFGGIGLELMGGSDFSVPTIVLACMIGATFLDQWNGLSHYVLICHERTRFIQNAWLCCGLLNIGLNLIAVPRWGLPGAAVVTFGSFFVLELAIFLAASRHADLLLSYRTILHLKLGVVAAIPMVVVPFVGRTTMWNLALASVLYWSLYILMVLGLRLLDAEDIGRLRQLVRG